VLIVIDLNGQVCDFVQNALNKKLIKDRLKQIADGDAVLCTDETSCYRIFVKQETLLTDA
jgi:hypothetical protein